MAIEVKVATTLVVEDTGVVTLLGEGNQVVLKGDKANMPSPLKAMAQRHIDAELQRLTVLKQAIVAAPTPAVAAPPAAVSAPAQPGATA